MSLDERIATLSARASYGAWTYLQRLRNHPKLPELLASLEQLDGTLAETDIEQAFRRLMVQASGKSSLTIPHT